MQTNFVPVLFLYLVYYYHFYDFYNLEGKDSRVDTFVKNKSWKHIKDEVFSREFFNQNIDHVYIGYM